MDEVKWVCRQRGCDILHWWNQPIYYREGLERPIEEWTGRA
jgi:hypothetical protein